MSAKISASAIDLIDEMIPRSCGYALSVEQTYMMYS